MSVSPSSAPRLLYVLPRYDADSAEHVYHLYGFLCALQTKISLSVVVENLRGVPPADLPMAKMRFRNPIFRFLEELICLIQAGVQGTRIFYVHYSYPAGMAAAIAARLTGGVSYYWNCGLFAEFSPPRNAPLRRRFGEWLNRWLLKLCVKSNTFLVTGTPGMGAYYSQHSGVPLSKIRIMPNFVEVGRFQAISRSASRKALGIPEAQTVLLYLHRVVPRKGAHYLPAIALRLTRELGPVRILVAGDGPYLPILRQRVRQEGVGDCFDFRGWIPNRDVPAYFRAADLFLMPSDEEGFPRVLLESMAAECPFVAFDVGGVRDILSAEQLDCVVPARDVDGFTRRCFESLKDSSARAQYIRAGRDRAARFSQEHVQRAFLQMLDGEPLDWASFLAEETAP
jgi:glycosyltransferase involved in cell wall biosynthesis